MKVTVRFFAQQREEVGRSQLEMEVAEGTTVAALVAALGRDYSALEAASRYLVTAVNAEYVDTATVLRPGDEVALIPPVSGGLCCPPCAPTGRGVGTATSFGEPAEGIWLR